MSDDRKRITVDTAVYDRLKAEKGQWEKWDGLLAKAADLLEEHHNPVGPPEENDE